MTAVDRARPTVGVLGLGRMGAAAAARLSDRADVLGYDVVDRHDLGVALVDAPEALFERCDVVSLFLPTPADTRAVFDRPGVRAAFDAREVAALDHSTADPASFRALAASLGPAARRLLDAPVLGRPDRCGQWTLPVGGDEAVLERVRPVLAAVAARVAHVGPWGAGHTMKLLNNLMFAAINVATAESIAACDALGVDPRRFVELVTESQAATVSPLFRDLAPRMLGEARPTVFTVGLLAKDLRLAVRTCEDAGAPLALARVAQQVVDGAVAMGLAQADSAGVVGWYRRTATEGD